MKYFDDYQPHEERTFSSTRPLKRYARLLLHSLLDAFGSPCNQTKKVCRWHLAPSFDIVAQVDVGEWFGEMWLPDSPDIVTAFQALERVPWREGVNPGRHSGTNWMSMRKRAAQRLRMPSEGDIRDSVEKLQQLAASRLKNLTTVSTGAVRERGILLKSI